MATEILKEHSTNLLEWLNKLPTNGFLFKETRKTVPEQDIDNDNDRKKMTQAELDKLLNELERDEFYWKSVYMFLNLDYPPKIMKVLSDAVWETSFEAIKKLSSSSKSYESLTNEEKLDLYKLICLLDGTTSYYDAYIKSNNLIDKENYELCKLNLERKIKSMKMNQ